MNPVCALLSVLLALPLSTQAQWVDIPDPNVLGFGDGEIFCFIDDQVGFASLWGCRIARTSDGGQTWTLVGDYDSAEPNGLLSDIDFDVTGTYGVAIGQNGFALDPIGLVSHDGGLSWQEAPDLSGFSSVADWVHVVDVDAFLINESFNSWALTTDGGQNFTPAYINVGFVQFLDPLHAFRLNGSSTGELAYSNDGGQSWVERDVPGFFVPFSKFCFADTLHGLLVRESEDPADFLLHTTNGGLTWDTVLYAPSPTVDMAIISISREGNALAVMQNDDTLHIYLSSDFGATWTEHPLPEQNIVVAQATTGGVFYAVGNSAPNNYWRWSGPVGLVPTQAARPFWTYDVVNSTLSFPVPGRVTLRVQDMSGRLVLNTSLPGGSSVPLRLNPGIYLVQAEGNGVYAKEKLFVR